MPLHQNHVGGNNIVTLQMHYWLYQSNGNTQSPDSSYLANMRCRHRPHGPENILFAGGDVRGWDQARSEVLVCGFWREENPTGSVQTRRQTPRRAADSEWRAHAMTMIGCDVCATPGHFLRGVIFSDALDIYFQHVMWYIFEYEVWVWWFLHVCTYMPKLQCAFGAPHMGTTT